MFTVKGFAPNALLFNNAPNIVNEVGEISTFSTTYAKEKGVYKNSTLDPNLSIITFECHDDGTPNELPVNIQNNIINVLAHVYNYTITNPGVIVDHAEILNSLIDEFGDVAENFSAGAMRNDGTHYVPEFVTWTMKVTSAQITFWLVDSAFRIQYPNYEIEIIPPIWAEGSAYPLDGFFQPGGTVEQMLNEVTMTQIAERMQEAKDEYPETFIRVDNFDYHDPNNSSRVVGSPWGILIYGIAGNNLDAIKDKLQEFILANSNHPREDWIQILPDIFRRTEFLLIPAWDHIAIPDQVAQLGIHSSVMFYADIPNLISRFATDYPALHITNHAMVTGWPWRSLAMCSIGSPENRDGKFRINEVYPDWIAVPSTSLDFNRMTLRTRQWFEKIQNLLYAAETFQEFSTPPAGASKLIRDGNLFLSTSIENVHYLVLCKVSI